MKLLIQKVNFANIVINDLEKRSINEGIVIYVGISRIDDTSKIKEIVKKIYNLRLFEDENGKINLSYKDKKYDVLVVSNFTLYADFTKGSRPSFSKAKEPNEANIIYNEFVKEMKKEFHNVIIGEFGAFMKITQENNGPVNLIYEN